MTETIVRRMETRERLRPILHFFVITFLAVLSEYRVTDGASILCADSQDHESRSKFKTVVTGEFLGRMAYNAASRPGHAGAEAIWFVHPREYLQMPDETHGSISACFHQLVAGDDEALSVLWQRYFDGLLSVARKQLGRAPRRAFDEEDIAISVFDCLRKGAEQGRFDEMRDRTDLWKLLVSITRQKSIDRIRRETAQKRGGGATRGESAWADQAEEGAGIHNFVQHEPTPDELVAIEEENQLLLSRLRDDSLRRVAVLRLYGHTNQEIAEKLGVATRTVERKLKLIRADWQRQLDKR